MSVLDGAGNELMRSTEQVLSSGRLDSDDIEVLREDLTDLLHERTAGDVEYLFGDSAVAIDQDDHGVRVEFGWVALVGDAGYCASPLSGQGTSLALVGAYVLAAELAAAAGDHRRAFAGYERRRRPFAAANQALATENPGGPPTEESMARAKRAISLDG